MVIQRLLLSEMSSTLGKDIDLLIVSASFESRCRSIADHIRPEQVKAVLVAEYRDFADSYVDNMNYLVNRFEHAHLVELDTSDPNLTADSIVRTLRELAGAKPKKVVVDISTFTREGLLILYRAINTVWRYPISIIYVYARAKEYSVGAKLEDKWLSRGIAEVRSVVGYPGDFTPSRRLHLIVLVGFEYDRVAELIRRCEPSICSLGQAIPSSPDDEEHRKMHQYNYQRLRSVFGDVQHFGFPGYDPDGACGAVLQQYKKYSEFNCMVAPMNTKVSTLGTAKAATLEPAIQVIYAQAMIYNLEKYSLPGDACYIISGS